MRYLPSVCTRCPRLSLAPIASLILLTVILPGALGAASITHTYTAYLGFASDSFGNARQEVPVAGFDSTLGQFTAATVSLTLNAIVDVAYVCDETGVCGSWKEDPDGNGEMIWEPDPYPYDLRWTLQVDGRVFPDWGLPDWASGLNAHVSSINYEYSEAPPGPFFSDQYSTYHRVLTSMKTSSDAVFVADDQLIYLIDASLSIGNQGSGNYRMMSGLNADATFSIRYDYQPAAEPVPEPNFKALTFLALISLALMTKLLSPKHR
jgi:hypothetical protein